MTEQADTICHAIRDCDHRLQAKAHPYNVSLVMVFGLHLHCGLRASAARHTRLCRHSSKLMPRAMQRGDVSVTTRSQPILTMTEGFFWFGLQGSRSGTRCSLATVAAQHLSMPTG